MLRLKSQVISLVAIVLIFLAGCSSSISPIKPPKSLEKVENTFFIKQLWQFQIGDGVGDNYLRLTPVVNNNILYSVDHTGAVSAIRMNDRGIVWEMQVGMDVGSPLTLNGDTLYLGTSEGYLVALESKTGKLIWKARVGSEVLAAPAVGRGLVVARCVNGEIYTFKASDGKKVWSDRQITPSLTLRGTSAPVISNDIVLSAFDNGKLIAYNLQTGRIIWQKRIAVPSGRTTLERLVDIDANIIVSDNVVYTIAFQGKLVAVSLGSGQIIWSRDIESYIGMAVDPYRIYVADSNSKIWALDKSNGVAQWKQDSLLRRSATKPVLHSNYVVLGDFNGFLHWFRRDTGKLVARVRLDSFNFTDPNLDEEEDLKFPKSNDILATPITMENVLIAVDRHGNTEAFEISYP